MKPKVELPENALAWELFTSEDVSFTEEQIKEITFRDWFHILQNSPASVIHLDRSILSQNAREYLVQLYPKTWVHLENCPNLVIKGNEAILKYLPQIKHFKQEDPDRYNDLISMLEGEAKDYKEVHFAPEFVDSFIKQKNKDLHAIISKNSADNKTNQSYEFPALDKTLPWLVTSAINKIHLADDSRKGKIDFLKNVSTLLQSVWQAAATNPKSTTVISEDYIFSYLLTKGAFVETNPEQRQNIEFVVKPKNDAKSLEDFDFEVSRDIKLIIDSKGIKSDPIAPFQYSNQVDGKLAFRVENFESVYNNVPKHINIKDATVWEGEKQLARMSNAYNITLFLNNQPAGKKIKVKLETESEGKNRNFELYLNKPLGEYAIENNLLPLIKAQTNTFEDFLYLGRTLKADWTIMTYQQEGATIVEAGRFQKTAHVKGANSDNALEWNQLTLTRLDNGEMKSIPLSNIQGNPITAKLTIDDYKLGISKYGEQFLEKDDIKVFKFNQSYVVTHNPEFPWHEKPYHALSAEATAIYLDQMGVSESKLLFASEFNKVKSHYSPDPDFYANNLVEQLRHQTNISMVAADVFKEKTDNFGYSFRQMARGQKVEVSERIYDQAMGSVPPISLTRTGFVMGEAYSGSTYYTFQKTEGKYYGELMEISKAKDLLMGRKSVEVTPVTSEERRKSISI